MFGWRDDRKENWELFSSRAHQKSIHLILGLLGWRDFREDGKDRRKNGRENDFSGCWLKRWKEKKLVGPMVLSLWIHQKLIPPIGGGMGLNGKWLIYFYCDAYNTCILLFYNEHVICFFFFFIFFYILFYFIFFHIKWQNFKLLLGTMENRGEKWGEKMDFVGVWLERWYKGKLEGQGVFSLGPPKIDPLNLGLVWMERFQGGWKR